MKYVAHSIFRWPNLKFPSGLPLTDRTFAKLCAANRDLRFERTADGELVIMTPAGADSGGRNSRLSGQLYVWAQKAGLGPTFDSSAGFTLPNGAIRAPDASWIAQKRWDALSLKEKQSFAPICPDFVVELGSPSDTRDELRAKLKEYKAQGARLGWLIDRKAGEVEIYRKRRKVETLKNPKTLSGEKVLPGFVLDLKGILFD